MKKYTCKSCGLSLYTSPQTARKRIKTWGRTYLKLLKYKLCYTCYSDFKEDLNK